MLATNGACSCAGMIQKGAVLELCVSLWNCKSRFVVQSGAVRAPALLARLGSLVDFGHMQQNNLIVKRPETVRRVKSYSAATGYVYQYQFQELRKSQRGFSPGTEYLYLVSSGRRSAFPLRIFIRRGAVEKWGQKVGREMTGTEEYAVAKMRLFQAFDEMDDLAGPRPELVVDESNLETLLGQLDL